MSIGVSLLFSRKNIAALVVALTALDPTRALAMSPARSEAPQRVDAPQYEALPLERSWQNRLLVRAEINGRPAALLVDTGSPLSVVSVDRSAHFKMDLVGAKSRIPTRLNVNGTLNSMSIARSLQFGALNLVDQPMVLIDLAHPWESYDQKESSDKCDGILGTDILSPLKAVLDYDRMLLVLQIDPRVSGRTPGFNFHGYRRVRMHESDGFNLYVTGSVNGTAAKLMVDTGAFATLLHSPFVRRMNIPVRRTKFTSSGINLTPSRVHVATITRFSVGSMDMQSHRIGVINLDQLIQGGVPDASPPMVGLLGSELLHRYHAIIDFGTNSLYLKQ